MRRTQLFSGSSNKTYLLCFCLLYFFNPAVYSALASDSTLDLRNVSVANLIDDLVAIERRRVHDFRSGALRAPALSADNGGAPGGWGRPGRGR